MSTYAASVIRSKMTRCVFALVFVLLDYAHSAPAVSEIVWLKDVTTRDKANTRSFEDNQLPDQLTFHLTRRSGPLTLTLKRNYDIDPNADIYVVQDMKNGRPIVTKTNILEEEVILPPITDHSKKSKDIAYYQDVKNGAYMTVRCVRKFNQQCNRVINGNVRIEKRTYYLRPTDTDIISRNDLEVRDLIGKQYHLLDETDLELERVVNQDSANVKAKHKQDEREALLRHFTRQQKRNIYSFPDASSSSQNVADRHDDMVSDTGRQLKTEYDVKVAVLIDFGIWTRHSAEVKDVHALFVSDEVKLIIREAYSHIMNGVNLHYKAIDDPSIRINIILQDFIFLKKCSEVVLVNGRKYLEAHDCLVALEKWDNENGINHLPVYDHAMLFTSNDLFINYTSNNFMKGADHDGEGDAKACKSEDGFIMTTHGHAYDEFTPYSRNPWIFSNCSVESFKKKLQTKRCVKIAGTVFNILEWSKFLQKQAGDVFTPDKQCRLAYGHNSQFVGTLTEDICHILKCTNPAIGRRRRKFIYAARGTMCGENKWCIEGRCISKS